MRGDGEMSAGGLFLSPEKANLLKAGTGNLSMPRLPAISSRFFPSVATGPLFCALLLGPAAEIAWTAPVDAPTALAAAEAFVSTDAVGRALLDGCTVESAEARGRLWIVRLSPAGHVIIAGSDRASPIVGFTKNDFVEPDPESPAFALLEGSGAAIDVLDADAAVPRHARWDELLGGGRRGMSAKIAYPPSSAIVVQPFLQEHYNQCQPYNDYSPICNTANANNSYRGRDPCGCVATAAAQVFHHFQWPALLSSRTVEHGWRDAVSPAGTLAIRFDGRAPLDWRSLDDSYTSHSSGYDLRGKVDESVRYPIARLILWCDSLARMSFYNDGSSANYGTVVGNVSDWYYPGELLAADGDLSAAVESLRQGIPCPVELYGHQVVGHGWASAEGSQYIYFNFGWAGSSDGWYTIPGVAGNMDIETVLAGHFPRAKPQIDPPPAVTERTMTLSWHFPDFHADALDGFFVQLFKVGSRKPVITETFSSPNGYLAGSGVGIDASNGYSGPCLSLLPYESGSYTMSNAVVLSAASMADFKVRGVYAQSSSLKLLASFDGGDWETVATPTLPDTGDSGWKTVSVYLGDRGGKSVQLRVANEYQGGIYYPSGFILVDNIKVTNVFEMQEDLHFTPRPDERSLTVYTLTQGARYTATVTPLLSAGALAPAETSEPVSWTVAGTSNVLVPGELSYSKTTLSYSSSAIGDVWSANGTQVDSTSVRGEWEAVIEATLPGPLTATSTLAFSWKATGYYTGAYGTGSDAFSAVFTDEGGNATTLWTKSNSANQTTAQAVSIPLSAYAGKSGSIAISFSHSGLQYTDEGYGGTIIAPTITDVMRAVAPDIAYATVTNTALGMPEILAVETAHGTDMKEGFYRECSRAGTVLYVTCSPTVTSLRALPSHLTFVPDSAVSVHSLGGGEFAIEIGGSGVTDTFDRSRMILTLEAKDDNGTTVCKDLSLRFSSKTPSEDDWAIEVGGSRVADGTPWTADLPYLWFAKNGVTPQDATSAGFAMAAQTDSDGDGLPNWCEWICGTSPTNATDTLRVLISMENGLPVLDYAPHTLREGFTPVYIGTTNLSPALWSPADLERHRFFRVVIEKP